MINDIHMSITEITILHGKTKGFILDVDGIKVTIPIDEAIFARYQEQFYRKDKPTSHQQKRMSTLLNLMRAAYQQGKKDATK